MQARIRSSATKSILKYTDEMVCQRVKSKARRLRPILVDARARSVRKVGPISFDGHFRWAQRTSPMLVAALGRCATFIQTKINVCHTAVCT